MRRKLIAFLTVLALTFSSIPSVLASTPVNLVLGVNSISSSLTVVKYSVDLITFSSTNLPYQYTLATGLSVQAPNYVTSGLAIDFAPLASTDANTPVWTNKVSSSSSGTLTKMLGSSWAVSGAKKVMQFSAAADYIEIPNYTVPNTATIEYWVYPTSLSGNPDSIFGTPNLYTELHSLWVGSDVWLPTLWADNTQSQSTKAVPLNQWSQVDVDMTNKRLYLNGVDVTTPFSISWTHDNMPNWIGHTYTTYDSFKGYLGAFRIYNGALTQAEITQNYKAGF